MIKKKTQKEKNSSDQNILEGKFGSHSSAAPVKPQKPILKPKGKTKTK